MVPLPREPRLHRKGANHPGSLTDIATLFDHVSILGSVLDDAGMTLWWEEWNDSFPMRLSTASSALDLETKRTGIWSIFMISFDDCSAILQ